MKTQKKKILNVLLDMSCSILHHGHIRLIKKASKYGRLIISLTSDKDLKRSNKSLKGIIHIHFLLQSGAR